MAKTAYVKAVMTVDGAYWEGIGKTKTTATKKAKALYKKRTKKPAPKDASIVHHNFVGNPRGLK